MAPGDSALPRTSSGLGSNGSGYGMASMLSHRAAPLAPLNEVRLNGVKSNLAHTGNTPVTPKVMFIEVRPKDEPRSSQMTEDAAKPPPLTTPPEMAGWVKKRQGGLIKSYKKRWFEVRGSWLFYYTKGDPTPQTKPSGVMDLFGARVEKGSDPRFSYTITGKCQASVQLAHDAEDEYTRWVELILERTQARVVDDTPEMIFEGDSERRRRQSLHGGEEVSPDAEKVGLQDFELLQVIGRGSFARVWKAKKRGTDEIYAMKALRKDHIIKENMVENTRTERAILQIAVHPFVVRMAYAFQTRRELFLILDYLPGGELFCHMQNESGFSEDRARFYAAEITLALGFLHSKGIIYRDLKPENLVLDKRGNVCLTDFGLSKCTDQFTDPRTYTFCGTPEYLAPEILDGSGHTHAVDWWSLGILIYEMIVGLPPFYSEDLNVMYDLIMRKPLMFPDDVVISNECKDLISRFLQREESHRLSDPAQIKAHPWFKGVDWDALLRKEVEPPFEPSGEYVPEDLAEGIPEIGEGDDDGADDMSQFDGFYYGGMTRSRNDTQRSQSPTSPNHRIRMAGKSR